MVTVQDVAERAGVSITTASYALRNDPRVRQKTAAAVLKAAKELNYTANFSARNLRNGSSHVIGFSSRMPELPYSAELTKHLSYEVRRRGYYLLTQQSAVSDEDERSIIREFSQQLCDGMIFDEWQLPATEMRRLCGPKPIVVLDDGNAKPVVDCVYSPSFDGAYAAVSHLIDVGCRNIAILGTEYIPYEECEDTRDFGRLRLAGALKACRDRNVKFEPGNAIKAAWTAPGGRDAIHRAIAGGLAFDGLFCMSDTTAFGALRGLHDCGVNCPKDVAVIGFDGIFDGGLYVPTLSTIAVDFGFLAKSAVDLLINRIENPPQRLRPKTVTIPFTLVQRESTTRV